MIKGTSRVSHGSAVQATARIDKKSFHTQPLRLAAELRRNLRGLFTPATSVVRAREAAFWLCEDPKTALGVWCLVCSRSTLVASRAMRVQELDTDQALVQLRRENALLRRHLLRTCPAGGGGVAAARCDRGGDGEALTPAEKYELCIQEVEVAGKEALQVRVDGEEEHATLLARLADSKQQEAGIRKDIGELLKLLGLEACLSSEDSSAQPAAGPGTAAAPLEQPGQEPPQQPSSGTSSASSSAPSPVSLPPPKQLARLQIPAARVEALLEAYLSRHDASAVRLELRIGMLKPQLAKLQAQQAAREGACLTAVDYEQLQIEHRQAEAAMRNRSAEATALKTDVSRALQQLAGLRRSLGAAEADSQHMVRQLEEKERELGAAEAQLESVGGECSSLQARCKALREAKHRSSADAPRVMAYLQVTSAARCVADTCLHSRAAGSLPRCTTCRHAGSHHVKRPPFFLYLLPWFQLPQASADSLTRRAVQVKSSVSKAEEKVRDLHRKIEIAAGRQRRPDGPHN